MSLAPIASGGINKNYCYTQTKMHFKKLGDKNVHHKNKQTLKRVFIEKKTSTPVIRTGVYPTCQSPHSPGQYVTRGSRLSDHCIV